MANNIRMPYRHRLRWCAVWCWLPVTLSAQEAILPLSPQDWAGLKHHSEQQSVSAEIPLGAYFSAGHFFAALPLQPQLSPDGQWLYYWRRQGLQYWLLRSQGDGEEQVLHKQREVPPLQLALSQDQQQLWLAAPDLLQVLDLRRKAIRTLWQPGFALPGQKHIPQRHSAQVIELHTRGAVVQWQQATTSYWFVQAEQTAQQIWPQPVAVTADDAAPQFWRNKRGQALFLQHSATRIDDDSPPATGLRPDISQHLLGSDGRVLATARLYQRLYWQSNDPGWQALLDQLQALQPKCSMQLQSAAADTRLLVSYFCSDQMNTQHLLLSLDERQQILRSQRLQLTAAAPQHAGVTPLQIAWQTADQQTIPAYLYLPPGRPLAQSPLVTLIHGGPFSRTDPAYDVLVQWLVNRGNIVLQPDYRSSAGYGQPFLQAAHGEFGRDNPALTDIFAGLDQLLANGIGDPAQQAVLGHSFGGYLAIQALQAQPQRFRFALALAAPVDLAATLKAYLPAESHAFGQKPLAQLFNDAGVPWQQAAWQQLLSMQSPQARLALLQRPLYLWAGGRDDRVSAASIQQFQQRALAQGKPVRLWLDPDSGHQAGSLHSRRLQFYLAASLVVGHLKPASATSDIVAAVPPALPVLALESLDSALQALEVRPELTGN